MSAAQHTPGRLTYTCRHCGATGTYCYCYNLRAAIAKAEGRAS